MKEQLQPIFDVIKSVTGATPVVHGGNTISPIEYTLSRRTLFQYRLTIYVNGSDMDKVQDTADNIIEALNDIGDTTRLPSCSIDLEGGGDVTKDRLISQILYFQLVLYKGGN